MADGIPATDCLNLQRHPPDRQFLSVHIPALFSSSCATRYGAFCSDRRFVCHHGSGPRHHESHRHGRYGLFRVGRDKSGGRNPTRNFCKSRVFQKIQNCRVRFAGKFADFCSQFSQSPTFAEISSRITTNSLMRLKAASNHRSLLSKIPTPPINARRSSI